MMYLDILQAVLAIFIGKRICGQAEAPKARCSNSNYFVLDVGSVMVCPRVWDRALFAGTVLI